MGNRWRVWGVFGGLLGLWSTSWPSLWWSYHERVIFYFLLCCIRLCDNINRDVRNTVMILYAICRLMCLTNPWAHMSFMHSILSLKLGVTFTVETLKLILKRSCQGAFLGSHRCWFAEIGSVKWMTLDLGELTWWVPTAAAAVAVRRWARWAHGWAR